MRPKSPAPGAEHTPRPRRAELARAWADAVGTTSYVPMSPAEIQAFLLELVDIIADALQAEPFSAQPVTEVGDRLVAANFTGPETLQRTVEVLGRALLFSPELRDVESLEDKVVTLLGTLGASFARAMRLDAFDQQEEVKWALLVAKQHAERTAKVSEARFREVFSSSAVGIAITDLDGVCVEANDALTEIMGSDQSSLVGRSLIELFAPEDAKLLAASYEDVRYGVVDRMREQGRLVRADGEPAWVHLAVSLLRDADGEPAYHVTVVEDVSELHLLQKNLDFQLLHDSLTGLSNRQHFITRLETMHSRAAITLYHLDLDAFSAVNNGLGHDVGDRMLKAVARKLESLVEGEAALVARIGGDEFAIVLEQSPTTPKVTEMIEMINAELAEPTFVDGHGLALSATIGVVGRPSPGTDVTELLRTANSTLRQAKARGKRQWMSYDQHEDARLRESHALAATLPGAWEHGELQVEYEPVVSLATRDVVGLAPRLCWGTRDHQECLDLAESTGLSIPIGHWVLRQACEHVAATDDLALHVALSPLQSLDEDLVGTVRRALNETGLAPDRLWIALNTGAVLSAQGDDNAHVLSDSHIPTALDGFRGAYDELALLAELPVKSVSLSSAPADPLARTAVGHLVALVHQAGMTVTATGVGTEEDASWWASVGADCATGPLFTPLED
jgi:diguanylate cyclase (GGDEF)-like protein/PAS domain S-box-containing protein